MSSPVDEKPAIPFPTISHDRSSDEEGTVVDDDPLRHNFSQRQPANNTSNLTVQTGELRGLDPVMSPQSPSQAREFVYRLEDDLAMLQVERQVSQSVEQGTEKESRSLNRSRSRHHEPVDEFEAATNPLHEKAAIYKPPEHPTTNFSKMFKKVHNSSWVVRYAIYIAPLVLIILLPLLLGALLFKSATVGGVKLVWFCIWLEIVWLTLWAGRILAKCLPWPIGLVSSVFTNNSKKWRDMGKQLELPATLFFWWLAIEISFLPTMTNHHADGDRGAKRWEGTMNKVIVSFFVGAVLNFVEKIIIQLIAISFHLRTYQDRIELNKFQIGSLTKLYKFSKEKIAVEDSEFETPRGPGSGARTPGQLVREAQKGTRQVLTKVGDVAGKIAGDFTGRQVTTSAHPYQVVLTLLNSTDNSQVLARRLYRTFAREETQTVHSDDLKNAFDNENEAEAAFAMFDKDMNGDISMEELEAVCVEIGRERKSITASLKDLDSVVSKLDNVFTFIVFVITVLVFISLISTSASGVLTSAGSTVLALSWLFSATAQEFLQSCIFVFVKHPFDVGDRVGIYGNTGATLKGDDYFVKEIALLYTEFKKMEGHVVQAPNSYLNTLFILNQRRSGGLAEAVPVIVKFGTTLDQIDQLRLRLLEFVKSEKREYQANILTELREVTEAHSITMNVVFFYKSNWQNELLRLQRRNKFICAMMVAMQELGIEGPRMRYPGQKESFPVYLQNVPYAGSVNVGQGGSPDNPNGLRNETHEARDPPFVPAMPDIPEHTTPTSPINRQTSITNHQTSLRSAMGRPRGESLSQMSKRVDFSLGMSDISSLDPHGDVYEDRARPRVPTAVTSPSRSPQDRGRSLDIGRTTSADTDDPRPLPLHRVGTDSSAARSNHRNRFFRRARGDSLSMVESGMAGIPEDERLDPRTGLVSPAAVRTRTREDGQPEASGASALEATREAGAEPPRRARTEGLEMRRLG